MKHGRPVIAKDMILRKRRLHELNKKIGTLNHETKECNRNWYSRRVL